jgi:hypothetical protein
MEPQVDDIIRIADRPISEKLLPGDDFSDSGYPGSQFRILANGGLGPIISVAVNVKITGKKTVMYNGACWLRCQIEFVGDCEPSTFCHGFIKQRF